MNVLLPRNLSSNMTYTEQISSYDTGGSIMYIFGVLVWYAFGFGLILLDDINPQPGRVESHNYASIYQTVSDMHEQQTRNDILVELKDKDRRTRLWQIYYGTQATHPTTVRKEKETVESIIKQLNVLNERRRLLRYTLNEISVYHSDEEYGHDDSDCESFQGLQMLTRSPPIEH